MIAFILACYGVLVYQLYVWQVRDAESYRAEAVTQQLKDTTLPAVRGSIYSANGKPSCWTTAQRRILCTRR